MDIVVKPKGKKNRQKLLVAAGVVIASLTSLAFFASSGSQHVVDTDLLLTDQVTQGELTITVRSMGVLAPSDVRWLAIPVSGKVERVHVKAGAVVQQGDMIVELSNPQLLQTLDETRWELDELAAQVHAQKVALESELLDQKAAVINEKLNYERSLLTLTAQETLLKQGVNAVSQIDHEAMKIEVAQNKQRWELEIARLEKQEQRVDAQLLADQARVRRMENTLKRVQDEVDSLQVKASIDAIVQQMPVELGQQVNAGTNLARLAKRDAFIAELRIPENQIHDIVIGQSVNIDTRTSEVAGTVKRIDPSVTNGVVQVDVELNGATPREARPELTVEGTIEIARIENALYVKRPMFARSFGDSAVYLVANDGQTATKQSVTFGKSSTHFIEIKDGLSVGQTIIVSDVSAWDTHQQITLN